MRISDWSSDVCSSDLEAYMNTGVQRSSATPPAARTNTTLAVGENPGAEFGQGKNLPLIAMAHEIPYVATATVADLHDLDAMVEKAMRLHRSEKRRVGKECVGTGRSRMAPYH